MKCTKQEIEVKPAVPAVVKKVYNLQLTEEEAKLLNELSWYSSTIPNALTNKYPLMGLKNGEIANLLGDIHITLESTIKTRLTNEES